MTLLPRKLRRDSRGATAVEFGFIAPALFVVAWGTVELGMTLLANTLLEGSVREAARAGLTGYTPSGMNRQDYIKNIVKENTIGLIDMNKLTIETKVYSSFADIGKPEPFTDTNGNGARDGSEAFVDINGNGQWDADMGVAGLGGPGDIVVYTLKYDWVLFAGYGQKIFGVNSFPLRASVAIRNEPY
ncbi:MAG: pilus assembly protein [Alphaproteobacteria bacterium]|nr:pilus assembly protein [Alphaproteobacteria bacterium]